MTKLLIVTSLFLVVSLAHAQQDYRPRTQVEREQYFDISEGETQLLKVTVQKPSFNDFEHMNDMPTDDLSAAAAALDKIIVVGEKIWKIVKAGAPVLAAKDVRAHALPEGVKNWQDMEGWQLPLSAHYRTTYVNKFNMNVVNFEYRVQFSYGGSVNGKGRYVADAAVVPTKVDVAWGYTFDASASVSDVRNAGTKENPVAGMELKVDWTVKTPIKESRNSQSYYVRGDGVLKPLDPAK